MYILNIAWTIKNMTVNEPRDFIFENYYKPIGFGKKKKKKNRKKYLILVMLRSIITLIWKEKTQNW